GGRPEVAGCGSERPGTDQDGVGARAKQRHEETVGRVLAADHRACVIAFSERDHAIDRRDEVRVKGQRPESDARVDPFQLERQQVALEAFVLVEDLKGLEQGRGRAQWVLVWLTASRNSDLSCGSDS